MKQPLFSVIMRLYNRADYLAEAIESVLKQTITDFELIICDDGSTDNPKPVIDYYLKRDSRIRYIRKKHTGIADTGNYAIERSLGKYIVQADSDDIQLPNKLEIALEGLKTADWTYSGYYHCNTKGEIWEYCSPKALTIERIKACDAVAGESIAYHRYVWEQVPYRPELKINDDYGFVWDLYKSGFSWNFVDLPSFKYRLLSDGTSYSKKKQVDKLTAQINKEIDDAERN